MCSSQLGTAPEVIFNNDPGEKPRAGRDHGVLILLVLAGILIMFVDIIKHNGDYG